MDKFKVGELVRVTSPGEMYTTYVDMFEEFGFRNTKRNDPPVNAGDLVRVFAKRRHDAYPRTLYACVTERGEEFLIGEDGLDNFVIKTFDVGEFKGNVSKNLMKVGCTEIDKDKFLEIIRLAKAVKFID